MSAKTVRIDLVSDVVCPWCVIGYKRLEAALAELKGRIEADIHWHPFELNPDMPAGGENLRSHLAAKYGTTLENSIKARANITALGAELGFQFDYFDEMKMFNTFLAHQLLHFARLHNREHELKLRLFSAFFGERKEVDQIDVLVREAEAVGLDGSSARTALKEGIFANEVRAEESEWVRLGIHSVPTFVINRTTAISGAQPIPILTDLLLKAREIDTVRGP